MLLRAHRWPGEARQWHPLPLPMALACLLPPPLPPPTLLLAPLAPLLGVAVPNAHVPCSLRPLPRALPPQQLQQLRLPPSRVQAASLRRLHSRLRRVALRKQALLEARTPASRICWI